MDWEMIMAICGGIVLLYNAGSAIVKAVSPAAKMKNTVKQNREDIDRLQRHEKNDLESLKEIRRMSRTQCDIMLLILNHMIDGNHADDMKKTRRKLQELLADIKE